MAFDNKQSLFLLLVSHSGIRASNVIKLKKSDFDFDQQIITVQSNKHKSMYHATIRDGDLEWLNTMVNDVQNKLFDCSLSSMIKSLNLEPRSTHKLRHKLLDDMTSLGASGVMIAAKMGFIDSTEPEYDKIIQRLIDFERRHFAKL